MTRVVESVQGDNDDDSHNIVSHVLGENLDLVEKSGLRQLIENAPVEFGTVLEGEGYTADVRRVTTGHLRKT